MAYRTNSIGLLRQVRRKKHERKRKAISCITNTFGTDF